MDRLGLRYAEQHLETARDSLKSMNMPDLDRKETERHWINFIQASNSYFAKLQQGSKSSPASIEWFKKVNEWRKADELMNYLHHARNAAEHTLKLSVSLPIMSRKPKFIVTVTPPDGSESEQKSIRSDLDSRRKPLMDFDRSKKLIPRSIIGRNKAHTCTFNGRHDDKDWGQLTSTQMAYLALEAMEKLFGEAKTLT